MTRHGSTRLRQPTKTEGRRRRSCWGLDPLTLASRNAENNPCETWKVSHTVALLESTLKVREQRMECSGLLILRKLPHGTVLCRETLEADRRSLRYCLDVGVDPVLCAVGHGGVHRSKRRGEARRHAGLP